MSKSIALAIGMTGIFYANGQSAGQRAEITRIWSETCVNIKITSGAGYGSPDPTSVFVPPLGTSADRHPAGYYFLPDAFIAASQADETKGQDRPQTFGEKAVGLSFNPSNQDDVAKAKAEAAALIDRAHDLRQARESAEVKRMASLAITHAQEAQMWLVKAQTWKD